LTYRWDETWHRLREWTNGQGPSERLAAQILIHEGYNSLDPSHPLGGKDQGKDAVCQKGGQQWLMAVYFPRGQQDFNEIKKKLLNDLKGVTSNQAGALAFVTNQELRLAERQSLHKAAENEKIDIELFHLERIATILDQHEMISVRKQFLGIDFTEEILRQEVEAFKNEVLLAQKHLEAVQTGGDTFCYWMLYKFDLVQSIARHFVIIRCGEHPLYDVRLRIRDMNANRDIFSRSWGEINAPADDLNVKWTLPESAYYRVFFHARNGSWNQDILLNRSTSAGYWLAATCVRGKMGEIRFEDIDNCFISEFGAPTWRE
jgi:hypothetical protein